MRERKNKNDGEVRKEDDQIKYAGCYPEPALYFGQCRQG